MISTVLLLCCVPAGYQRMFSYFQCSYLFRIVKKANLPFHEAYCYVIS